MTEVRVGPLVSSSLYEAIRELLPERLEFYETWLHGDRLPDPRGSAAPMAAVLGFLRTEGANYDRVMERAGQVAAAWTVEALTPWKRTAVARLPAAFRARAAVRVVNSLVRSVHEPSRLSRRMRRGHVELGVTASLFCAVREAPRTPLCGFYLAAVLETLRRFSLVAEGRLTDCRAIGGSRCGMVVDWSEPRIAQNPAEAA